MFQNQRTTTSNFITSMIRAKLGRRGFAMILDVIRAKFGHHPGKDSGFARTISFCFITTGLKYYQTTYFEEIIGKQIAIYYWFFLYSSFINEDTLLD
jgi:hypothetical protein